MGRKVVHLNIIFPLNQNELRVSADLLLMIVMRLLMSNDLFQINWSHKVFFSFYHTYFPDLIRKFRR